MTETTVFDDLRELACRTNDGLEVTLLWSKVAGELLVSVLDEKTGDQFVIPAERATALDVFYHPFAYAAARGIEYRTPMRDADAEDVICA